LVVCRPGSCGAGAVQEGVEERAGDVEGCGQGVQPGVQGAAGCFGAVPAD